MQQALENTNEDLTSNSFQAISLKALSSIELKARVERLVGHERKLTAVILEHIQEVNRRQAFIDWGYESLYTYLTQGLRYSEGAAYRRMQAAKLLTQMPQIQNKIEDGSLKLSQVTLIQSAIRKHESTTGEKLKLEEKTKLIKAIEGKNKVETQKLIDQRLDLDTQGPFEKITFKADDSIDFHVRLPAEVSELLTQVRALYSHIAPGASWVELLKLMAVDVITKRDPARAVRSHNTTKSTQRFSTETKNKHELIYKNQDGQNQLTQSNRRKTLSLSVKRLVFQRAQSKCQYEFNGKLCGSNHQLEIDHIMPVWAGGQDNLDNLRLVCRTHNQYRYKHGQ